LAYVCNKRYKPTAGGAKWRFLSKFGGGILKIIRVMAVAMKVSGNVRCCFVSGYKNMKKYLKYG
jgi:hypothetical protein